MGIRLSVLVRRWRSPTELPGGNDLVTVTEKEEAGEGTMWIRRCLGKDAGRQWVGGQRSVANLCTLPQNLVCKMSFGKISVLSFSFSLLFINP